MTVPSSSTTYDYTAFYGSLPPVTTLHNQPLRFPTCHNTPQPITVPHLLPLHQHTKPPPYLITWHNTQPPFIVHIYHFPPYFTARQNTPPQAITLHQLTQYLTPCLNTPPPTHVTPAATPILCYPDLNSAAGWSDLSMIYAWDQNLRANKKNWSRVNKSRVLPAQGRKNSEATQRKWSLETRKMMFPLGS